MFLNREPLRPGPFRLLDNGAMRRRAAEALEDIGVNIPNVNEEVAMLSGGQRQAVAIARAVYSKAKILLLDEPLAAMGARESGLILDLIDRLKKRGDLSLIMIAHNYAQTLEVSDRIMMFQHGEVTFERAAAETFRSGAAGRGQAELQGYPRRRLTPAPTPYRASQSGQGTTRLTRPAPRDTQPSGCPICQPRPGGLSGYRTVAVRYNRRHSVP